MIWHDNQKVKYRSISSFNGFVYGILICVGLLFGDDSEGNSSTGLSSGGSNVSLEVLKHRPLVEVC